MRISSLSKRQPPHESNAGRLGLREHRDGTAILISRYQGIAMCMPQDHYCSSSAQANPMTAYGMLDFLQIPAGEYLLQNAANSTLGKMVISLARHAGVRTINVVRRKEPVSTA